uniref:(northern house mosquito) hypothetical protein n=1 Tax=Culex pipiens TaxID=7175 RepID=A0A8D8K932_CULPI
MRAGLHGVFLGQNQTHVVRTSRQLLVQRLLLERRLRLGLRHRFHGRLQFALLFFALLALSGRGALVGHRDLLFEGGQAALLGSFEARLEVLVERAQALGVVGLHLLVPGLDRLAVLFRLGQV